MIIKNHSNTHKYGQNYHWTYASIYRTRHRTTHVKWKFFHCWPNVRVDNALSNPLRNNGDSKVLGILLSDFVSRGSEHSLWRHHGHENKQFKSAQCQHKASAVSGRHICTVWHSAGISGKCRDIGIDFSGIAARALIQYKDVILQV